MDKKRRFDRANDIPNHDKYQKETFSVKPGMNMKCLIELKNKNNANCS